MPARDLYHETVKRALSKDGWTITHDPFKLPDVLFDEQLVDTFTFDPDEEVIVRWIP